MTPFYRFDWLRFRDLERCPFVWYSKECNEWIRQDDRRMLLIALDRYADYLQKKDEEDNVCHRTS
jgi:hypothetical protein